MLKNTAHATKRRTTLRKLASELEKRNHSTALAGDYGIIVDDCLTLVVVCNRETTDASQEPILFITVSSVDISLPGVLQYIETQLTKAKEQMSKKQIPTTWKGMRYSQDDRPKPVKHTYVDPDSLPVVDKSLPKYKQLRNQGY